METSYMTISYEWNGQAPDPIQNTIGHNDTTYSILQLTQTSLHLQLAVQLGVWY